MKGIIVTEELEVELVDDIPKPEINSYEALVKTECCMICNGTDTEIIRGELEEAQNFPLTLGHESCGRIVEMGDKVCSYKVGDRVIRSSLPDSDKYYSGWGGFSEYTIVTDTKAMEKDGLKNMSGLTQQVVPEGVTAAEASLMITLKEVCSAIDRIGIKKEDEILIVGDGPVGLCFLSDMQLLGIENVSVLGNRRTSLEVAKRLGAKAVYHNKDEQDREKAFNNLSGKVTVYLDTIGTEETIRQGMKMVKMDGKIAVYGLRTGEELTIPMKGIRNFNLQFVQWPIETSEMLTHKIIAQGILDKRIKTNELISHVLPIDEYKEGFAAITEKRALKVALIFEEAGK